MSGWAGTLAVALWQFQVEPQTVILHGGVEWQLAVALGQFQIEQYDTTR